MAKTVSGTKKVDTITVNAINVIVVTGKKTETTPITKSGKNYIFGDKGNDIIFVKGGKKNYIYGDDKKHKISGKDKITITSGTDNIVYGGKGNDTITINGGSKNTIYGGAGKDTFVFGKKGSAIIQDYKAGQDTLRFSSGIVTSAKLSGKNNVIFKAGNASATLTGVAKMTISLKDKRGSYTVSNTAIKLGKDFSDSINAGKYLSGVITIDGRAAVEAVDITGNAKANIIYAGKDGGTIKGGSKNDKLYGGKGEDILYGGTGDDIITGGAGDDELIGEYGNDILNGGAGKNTLYGGSGVDTFVYSGQGNDVVKDYTEEEDILEFTGGKIAKTAIIKKNLVYTFDNGKTMTLENVFGKEIEVNDRNGSYYYAIRGVDYNGISLGADYTGKFDMNVYAALVSLSANKTTGGINIVGNALNNYIYSGVGNDTLSGGKGNDWLNGGDGNDILDGGDGNDELDGGAGNNILTGGKGNDIFIIENQGKTTIKDYTEKEDLLSLDGYGAKIANSKVENNNVIFTVVDVDNGNNNKGVVIVENAAKKAISFGDRYLDDGKFTLSATSIILGEGYRTNTVDANAYFATITTIDARNAEWLETVIGNNQDNIIYAGNFGGEYQGGAGNDTIYGGDGSGSLYGGAGNDTITVSNSFSEIHGGAGDDLIVIKGGDSHTIYGDNGQDTITINAGTYQTVTADFDDKITIKADADATITVGGGNNLETGFIKLESGSSAWIEIDSSFKANRFTITAADGTVKQMAVNGDSSAYTFAQSGSSLVMSDSNGSIYIENFENGAFSNGIMVNNTQIPFEDIKTLAKWK